MVFTKKVEAIFGLTFGSNLMNSRKLRFAISFSVEESHLSFQ